MWSILADIKGKKVRSPILMNELHSHFKSILNNVPKNVAENKLKLLDEKVSNFILNKKKTVAWPMVTIGDYTDERNNKTS